jgi:hypothetical protein
MLSYIIDVYVDTALEKTSVLMLEGLWGAVGEKVHRVAADRRLEGWQYQ